MRKLLCFAMIAFVLLLDPSTNLYAMKAEQKQIIDSGALYFDLEANNVCGPGRLSTSNSSIFVIGDSLTVGMRDAGGLGGKLEAQNWDVRNIVAADSATIAGSLPSVNEQNVSDVGTVVIALGTNTDNDFSGQVGEIIGRVKEFSPNAQIKWINAYTTRSGYESVNATLAQRSSELGFSVIDWKAEALANPGAYPFDDDGIHHNAAGYSAKADFVARSLGLYGGDEQAEVSQGEGGDNVSIIFNYFVGKGLTDFQTAGIMGNMFHESGYEPRKVEYGQLNSRGEISRPGEPSSLDDVVPPDRRSNGQPGYGLVQFTFPTLKQALRERSASTGTPPGDIMLQLDFIWEQLEGQGPVPNKAAGDHLKATTTVADATISFELKYERHIGGLQLGRIVEAQRILDLARSGGIDVTANANSQDCGSSTSGGGNAVSTALEYAWPDYRGRGFTTLKPEYEVAVRAAQSEGRYVGAGGVDCGGFVTLVMVDSGFEPGYNTNGRGGRTEFQEQWTKDNWQTIGTVSSSAELRPGDVAFTPGHTFMYVGKQPGFETEVASAALGSRAPMAGNEIVTVNSYGEPVQWYRKR